MTDRTDKPQPHSSSAEQAPELHTAEQEDEQEQTQTVAEEARNKDGEASPLDSEKADEDGEILGDSSQDLIDRMRDMEQSGRIDMSAYRGEPNMDDDEDKYGEPRETDD
jgi:hypothetical protein